MAPQGREEREVMGVSEREEHAAGWRCRQRIAEGWCAAVPLWWHRERDAFLLMAEDEADHMRQIDTWEGRGW